MNRFRRLPFHAFALALLSSPAHAQRLDISYAGTSQGDSAGSSVSSGFDCDGDGVDDIAVGMPDQVPLYGYAQQGVVHVYSGATHAEIGTFTVTSQGANTGSAVALVGDIDGDGLCDLVFGASGWSGGAGHVEAWNVKTNTQLWYFVGSSGQMLGSSVAAAGDVDKDGHAEVLIGAPGTGDAYLYSWTGLSHTWHSTQSTSLFGKSVSGNVDVDGDGTPDVVVGSPLYDSVFPFSQDRGRVDVYSGANYATIWTGLGDHAGDYLGWSVCGLGDVNGDGRAEVLAGAPLASANGSFSGLVRKYDGSGAKLVDLIGGAPYEELGVSLAAVPDLTRDGLPEYVIGAPQSGFGGVAALIEGDDDALLWSFFKPDPSDTWYGNAVAAGDLDGDGLGDVVVADPSRTVNGNSNAGAADVWITVNATATNYGAGYPGTLGIPSLSALNDPGIGTTVTLDATNSRGSATTGLLLVGFTRLNVPTSAGGTLLVVPFEVLPIVIPATGASLSGSIPYDTGLLGAIVDLQVLEADPGAAHKLSFTDGLELLIGVDYP